MNSTIRPPVEKIRIEDRDFSLHNAMPQFAAAIETQIDRDDASDDFIKKKLHSKVYALARCSSFKSVLQPIAVYIDADACPVKQEVYRVAKRHLLKAFAARRAHQFQKPCGW
jgi:hypothetical protein